MPNVVSEWHYFLRYFPLDKAQWEFKPSTNLTPPLILYYSGVLSASPALRHLFLVSQLRGTDTENSTNASMPRPQALHPKATHDFSLIYSRGSGGEGRRDWLFHFQMSGSDVTAKQLAYFLVGACTQAKGEDGIYLGDRQYRGFWRDLAQAKLEQLKVDSRLWVDPDPLG